MCDTIANYVDQPAKELPIRKSVIDYEALGYACYEYRQINWKLEIWYAPVSKHYQDISWVDNIVRVYEDKEYNDGSEFTNYYAFIRRYLPGTTENHLYLLWSEDDLSNMTEVALDRIPITANYEPIERTWLDIPALVVVKEDKYEQEPTWDIKMIEQMIYALDRNIVMFQTQFLQNVESFILTKNINRPIKLLENYNKWSRINFSDIGRVVDARDDGDIKFINNVNDLIKEAIAYEDNQIRRISSTTSIPTDFLWLYSAQWAIGQWSRSILHGAFMKKIQYIRNVFDHYLNDSYELIAKRNRLESKTYSRPDIFAKSDNELITEIKLARDSQIVSQFKAIQRYQDLDEKGAEEELERIKEESMQKVEEAQEAFSNNKPNEGDNNRQPKATDEGGEDKSEGSDIQQ